MQQICHQLRSKGDMTFDEISSVVPWIELAADLGQDLEAAQVAEPRCFKTHCWYDHCPQGGRYIVVVREPADVALSFFKFFRGWFFQPGEVGLEEFVREFWLSRGPAASRMQNAGYFHHLLSWWPHRLDDNVLWVFFEDMKADLEGTVRRVNRFLSTQADEAGLATAVEHSTFAFMQAHGAQFDEHLTKHARNAACGLPREAGLAGSKLSTGQVGGAKEALSAEVLADIEKRWSDVLSGPTGYANYTELRAGLRKELEAHGRW
jgi:hypothetical protein